MNGESPRQALERQASSERKKVTDKKQVLIYEEVNGVHLDGDQSDDVIGNLSLTSVAATAAADGKTMHYYSFNDHNKVKTCLCVLPTRT